MFGLPADIDLDFFLDLPLFQICFGAHDLQLNFDDDLRLSIESQIEFQSKGGQRTARTDNYSQVASDLVTLLHQTVVSASGTQDGTLDLLFSEGARLTVYDSSWQYESYLITYGEKQIVV